MGFLNQNQPQSFGGPMTVGAGVVPAALPAFSDGASPQPQGNFLSRLLQGAGDFFSPQQIAARHPISNALGMIGDGLLAAGGNFSRPHETYVAAQDAKAQAQQQGQDTQSAVQAVLNNPQDNAAWATLARYQPDAAIALRKQLIDAGGDKSKLLDLAPGHVAYDPVTGKAVYTVPGQERQQPDAYSTQGGLFVRDPETNKFVFQPSGYEAPTKSSYGAINTPAGTMITDRTTGRHMMIPGTAPAPKTPKASDETAAASSQAALDALDNIQSEFKQLNDMGALAGQGSNPVTQALGALGRSPLGQAIGEQMGSPAAQTRLALHKNLSQLQQQMIKSLPASATRTKFEQEILQRGLPDPSKMDYKTAQTVIGQLRNSYLKAVQAANQSAQPSSGGSIPHVTSMADVASLPSGSTFYDPNGVLRKVP